MTVLDETFAMAQTLKAEGRKEEALQAYARVLAGDKSRHDVCTTMGHLLCDLGRPAEALVMFRRASALVPEDAQPFNGQGRALRLLNQPEEAFLQFKEALRRQPGLMTAYVDMAQLLIGFGQLKDAETCLESGLAVNPNFGPLHEGLGLIWMRRNHPPEALKSYQRALTLGPISAGLLSNTANCLMSLDRFDDALKLLEDSLALAPNMAVAQYNRGVCLTRLNRIEDAVLAYDKSLQVQPNNAGAQFNRALLWLKQGQLQQGFEAYHWRFRFDPSYKDEVFAKPRWQGDPLLGKTLLVVAEQGMGDTLQFARFLPQLKAQGATIILMVQPDLLSLFETWPEVDKLIPKPPIAGPTPMDTGLSYDYYTYLMSLPSQLGVSLKSLPSPIVFQNLPREIVMKWQDRLASNPRLKVGFVWASKADNPTSLWRSCPLQNFLALASACPNVSFYSLQKGPAQNDLDQQVLPANVTDLGPDLDDFVDTATAILQLDVILTVDTAVAHLAGCLGKSVWLLLPYWSDWRWLMSGEKSPWYPSVHIFRSGVRDDWGMVFEQVKAKLL